VAYIREDGHRSAQVKNVPDVSAALQRGEIDGGAQQEVNQ
jgi:hypothetical protein